MTVHKIAVNRIKATIHRKHIVLCHLVQFLYIKNYRWKVLFLLGIGFSLFFR